ncbi:MAG: HIT family protein [Bacteroidetes bacterium]|nr:MAG: HIT family protein [Bacteroidota bacterium]REK06051.1 MAG: HIT family protein [Bacteroidota bacterium]REK37109.1 MAG: HIT family protein [Bacteroidota bacterium]REK47499.1 MAG: HIT family protein [Bacteroidota bacterium]
MASIFSKIIKGEIPCYKIAENDKFFAFLDISPLAKGHTLVVPKQEIDYIFDLETELHKEYWDFARFVAGGVRKAIPCKRIGIAVIGLEVPHAHIHLIPMNRVSDMNFAMPKLSLQEAEMKDIAAKIVNCLSGS